MFFRKTDQQTNEQFLQGSGGLGGAKKDEIMVSLSLEVNNFDT